jgi:transcriptional regulator with GAF, ATPase, and Fis domain
MTLDNVKASGQPQKPDSSKSSTNEEDGNSPNLLLRYQLLIEIARDLASTFDLNKLLNRIVHAATELTNAKAASILLYDQINEELHFEATGCTCRCQYSWMDCKKPSTDHYPRYRERYTPF